MAKPNNFCNFEHQLPDVNDKKHLNLTAELCYEKAKLADSTKIVSIEPAK